MKEYDGGDLLVTFALGAALSAVFMGTLVNGLTDSAWETHLVKQGHAEWVSDKHGNAEFKLKEMK